MYWGGVDFVYGACEVIPVYPLQPTEQDEGHKFTYTQVTPWNRRALVVNLFPSRTPAAQAELRGVESGGRRSDLSRLESFEHVDNKMPRNVTLQSYCSK